MSKLGSLLTLEYGEAMPGESRSGHGFPVFGSNGEVGRHFHSLVAEPGIIVGRKGSVGKVTWSDEPFWPIDTTYWVRCAPEDNRWLYWVLNWLPLARLDSSTGIPGLNRNDVYALSIYYPSLAERETIVQILDTLDTAISETEAIIAKLKAVKQGLLHDLLTRGIDANGELRPPQSEAPHLYKESPLGWIPREWDDLCVGDLLIGIDAGWSPSCPEEPPNAGEWGVLKVSAVSSGSFDPQESKRLPFNLKPIPAIEVKTGDVLLARANGVAELVATTVLVRKTPSRLMLSDKTLRLVPDLGRLLPGHLARVMSASSTRKQINGMLNGSSGQQNISQWQIRNLRIAVPSISEQRICEDRNTEIEVRIVAELQTMQKLIALKAGLMDDLLTGRVRVTSLLDGARP